MGPRATPTTGARSIGKGEINDHESTTESAAAIAVVDDPHAPSTAPAL